MPEFSRWARALDLSDWSTAAVRATLFAPRAWADRPGVGLGPYIRERRLARRETLSRAAAQLGLPLATLGHYESGRVEVPEPILINIVGRFELEAKESAALCGGTGTFLAWCDALVEDPAVAQKAVEKAAFASTPTELFDRGPAFIRLRTGLLRARLRGDGWSAVETFATEHHGLWLAVRERRTEAAATLAVLSDENGPVAAVARRHLGRARAEELQTLAASSRDVAQKAWLDAEAALDLCERRRGPEARMILDRAISQADGLGGWVEGWMRRRDLVRAALRLRDWSAAQETLAEMVEREPKDLDPESWYHLQRRVLEGRLAENEATARPA